MTIAQIRQAANFCRGYNESTDVQLRERFVSKTIVLYVLNVSYTIQPNGDWECFAKSTGKRIDRGTYELER